MSGHLLIEAIVAAGPRKSMEEYRGGTRELCEDCAGYRTLGDWTVFWLCDGTSNSHELPARGRHPGLSTRTLARDLGEEFARIVTGSLIATGDPGSDPHESLLADVSQKWRERLEDYLTDVSRQGSLKQLLDQMPRVKNGPYRLKWSSTFLGGVYNRSEQTLAIVNVGESAALVIGREPAQVRPTDACEIIVATLPYDEPLRVEVCPIAMAAPVWERFEDVTAFLALSDGVSKPLTALLKRLERALKSEPAGDSRPLLLSQEALTYDDRAMIFCQLIPEQSQQAHEDSALRRFARTYLHV